MNNSEFKNSKFFIIDMDGTFYLGNKLISGADDFIKRLIKTGRDYRFFTNNSSNNVEVCRNKLEKMGFSVDENRVIVSTHVTTDFLNREYKGKKVYLLGNERLTADFEKAGVELVNENPDIVVLGFDTTLTYEKIYKAANYISQGKVYIATHPDFNCPMADGFMPDTGSMIEMFYASTGKRPKVMGKPMAETVEYITRLLSCREDELVFVGDRLATDIAIGSGRDAKTVLVLSGVTSKEEYESSDIKADVVVNSLAELAEWL